MPIPIASSSDKASRKSATAPARSTAQPSAVHPAFNPAWSRVALGIQPKLAVSAPGDPAEREADRLADTVMRMPEPQVQRKCAACSSGGATCPSCQEEEHVQRKADGGSDAGEVGADFASGLGGGSPLDAATRAFFEPRFGRSFDDVRVHANAQGAALARSIDARAFTLRQNIAFASGEYDPQSSRGRSLLAHELVHVAQQSGKGHAAVQRQAGNSESGGQPQADQQEDSRCKDAPRHLGDVRPEVPCDLPTMDLGGMDGGPHLRHFHFCLDSDELAAEDASVIGEFAHRQASKATFVVHGYASKEGEAEYNRRLSCHRALRISRELINAGVRPSQIREVSGLGGTSRFGPREFNRVAIVLAEGGEIDPLVDGKRSASTNKEKQAIVDEARRRLLAGQYRLEADRYISFWTCGRTATVSQGVERLTVNLPKGDQNESSRESANGVEEGYGVNTVTISNVALRADNPIECTMGRLVDMAFHHAVLGNPDLPADLTTRFDPEARSGDPAKDPKNKEARHEAGRHLIHLAGLSACRGHGAEAQEGFGKLQGIDPPREDDPRADKPAPRCTPAPQPTRQPPPSPGAKNREVPTFNVLGNPQYIPETGKLVTNFAQSSQQLLLTKPENGKEILTAHADVQIVGKPETFADYEIGFIQTILADETQVDYDSGHSVIQGLPVPIRLAAMKGEPSVPVPWTTMNAMSKADASGKASVTATGSGLNTEMAVALRRVSPSLPNAGVSQFEHQSQIAIWLIARRLGAALDRFSVHFLDGVTYNLLQTGHLEHRRVKDPNGQGSVLGDQELAVIEGGFHSSKPSLLPADPESARLLNPSASDIAWTNQVKSVAEPKPATESDMGIGELTSAITDILDNLVLFDSEEDAKRGTGGTKTPRLGFDYIPLHVTLPMVRRTGRLENSENRQIVVRIAGPGLDTTAAKELARALEFRIRDRTFRGKGDIVVRPSIIPGSGAVGDVNVTVPPLPPQPGAPKEQESDLTKRQDVLNEMAEAWACTALTKTAAFIEVGAREFGRAYWMDRDKKLHGAPEDHLAASGEEKNGVIELGLPCPEVESPGSTGVTLGDFHTHPDVVELDEKDLERAGHCGTQHFIVFENEVFRYFPDGTIRKVAVTLPKGQCHQSTLDQAIKIVK